MGDTWVKARFLRAAEHYKPKWARIRMPTREDYKLKESLPDLITDFHVMLAYDGYDSYDCWLQYRDVL
jgi:hypothetical protein